MEHKEPFASQARGIPYPFSDLPLADEPFTDVRLFDTLMPLLEGLAGIASVLAVASPDTMPRGQAAALRALAAQAEVAPTILRRWWEANHEED